MHYGCTFIIYEWSTMISRFEEGCLNQQHLKNAAAMNKSMGDVIASLTAADNFCIDNDGENKVITQTLSY